MYLVFYLQQYSLLMFVYSKLFFLLSTSIACFPENAKEKKKDMEKNVEMSKNAQFRAIQPSPSILSFVEDNVIFISNL